MGVAPGDRYVTVFDLNTAGAASLVQSGRFLRVFIPGFGVTDFRLQLFRVEMRLFERFAGGVGRGWRLRCFLIAHDRRLAPWTLT